MEIRLDRRSVHQIRLSCEDAMEAGDTETLREDIVNALTEEQIEEIERRIDSADFYDFLSEILDEWSAEDTDELFELLESQLADAGVDLKYLAQDLDDDDTDEDSSDEDEESEFDLAAEEEEL